MSAPGIISLSGVTIADIRFLSNKSRDITATEAIEEEDEYESSKGNEMYETLKKTF